MQIKVIRSVFTPDATMGKMMIDDKFFAYTLEDTYRALNGDCSKKVQNKTAIDAGRYEVKLTMSPRFGKVLPELFNVPCFAAIRIHGGNTHENTEGCILIGAESNMKDRIWNCAGSVTAIVDKIKAAGTAEKIFIEVINDSSVA